MSHNEPDSATHDESEDKTQTMSNVRLQIPTDNPYTWDFGIEFRMYTILGDRAPLTVAEDQVFEVGRPGESPVPIVARMFKSQPGTWEHGNGTPRYWLIPEEPFYDSLHLVNPKFHTSGRLLTPSADDLMEHFATYADRWYETVEIEGARIMRKGKDVAGRRLRGYWVREEKLEEKLEEKSEEKSEEESEEDNEEESEEKSEKKSEKKSVLYCFHRFRRVSNSSEIVDAPTESDRRPNGHSNGP